MQRTRKEVYASKPPQKNNSPDECYCWHNGDSPGLFISMRYGPVILGGIFFFIGLIIYVGTSFPAGEHSRFLGFTFLDEDLHQQQIRAALWGGVSITLMLCGSLVVVFLHWSSIPKKEGFPK